MRSVEPRASDLTARATIRNAALRLFADRGAEAVSVRQIAAQAGVSPALVLHHFGSKAGLLAAVDAHVVDLLDAAMAADDMAGALAGGNAGSAADVFARLIPPGSPLPGYIRRLLLSGDATGTALFRRWFEGSRRLLDQMTASGHATQSADPDVRAAFVLAGDLTLVLLRDQLATVLGVDPLSPEGMTRWAAEVYTITGEGMFRFATDPGPDQPERPDESAATEGED